MVKARTCGTICTHKIIVINAFMEEALVEECKKPFFRSIVPLAKLKAIHS